MPCQLWEITGAAFCKRGAPPTQNVEADFPISCKIKKICTYPANVRDRTTLGYLNESFIAEGYRIPELLRTIALSNAFSRVAEPYAPPGKTAAAASGAEASR